ncbi:MULTISPECIES: hypothetical protein [unclassified Bradyrhizobium]|uniref:hypothetical protein n=1 Tax=Bradyrhizobium sp. S3.9.2 TaxID=3156432 RepID=UPI003390E026
MRYNEVKRDLTSWADDFGGPDQHAKYEAGDSKESDEMPDAIHAEITGKLLDGCGNELPARLVV